MSKETESLSRDMSLFDITMIGVGAMIGAGIFVLTGEASGVAGPALILSFALNGIVALFTAMVYAELGSAIPEAGGGYLWIKEGLPGSNAFIAGWMSWFAHAVAGALYALGFGAFIFELLRIYDIQVFGVSFGIAKKIFGLLVAGLFAYINYKGASETGLAGSIVTLSKIAVIGLFCLFGLKFMFFPDLFFTFGEGGGMGTSQLNPFIPDETGWLGILSAMGLTFIAFEGYEIIVQAGEEVENPRRNIPKAVFWSLAIVVPIYMLVAFVLIGASQAPQLVSAIEAIGEHLPEGLTAASENWKILKHVGELGLARSAAQFVPFGATLILIGGLLSTMSALNATTFSSTRVAFAMGRDKNLPDMFGFISPKTRTPAFALLWTALLIGFMVAFIPITTVAAAADIMFLLLFLQVNVAVMTIRKKYGDKLSYGYLMPFYPVIPIIVIITNLGLALFMFDHYPIAWVYVLIWLAVGFGIYRFYAMHREREKEAPPVLAQEKALDVKPHSVLIPVADPSSAKDHIKLGAKIAGRRDSELVLLHAVRVPKQLPPSQSSDFVEQARPILVEAREYAEKFDVPVSTVIRVGHSVSKAIISTARDENTDYLLMGWKGSVHGKRTHIGSNIDNVLKESNTHAIVMQRTHKHHRDKEILVPIANPDNAPLPLAVASLLARGEVTMLHITEEPMTEKEKETYQNKLEKFCRESDKGPEELFEDRSKFNLEFAVAERPIEELIIRTGYYSRAVIGSNPGGLLGRKILGKTTARIADRARCPIIIARSREPGVKFEMQHFFQFFRELEEEGSPEPSENEDEKEE